MLAFLLISGMSLAQNTKNDKLPYCLYTSQSGNFIYDTVVNVNGVSKQDLYKRAKNWVISTIRTSDKTVVFDDTENNEIRTDATMGLPKVQGSNVNFKISIYFKEQKCRIVCESFMFHYIGSTEIYDAAFEKLKTVINKKIYKDFDVEFSNLRDSLIKSLLTSSNTTTW